MRWLLHLLQNQQSAFIQGTCGVILLLNQQVGGGLIEQKASGRRSQMCRVDPFSEKQQVRQHSQYLLGMIIRDFGKGVGPHFDGSLQQAQANLRLHEFAL